MILSENRYPLFGIMLYLVRAIFRRAGLGWLGADSWSMARSISRAPALVSDARRPIKVSSARGAGSTKLRLPSTARSRSKIGAAMPTRPGRGADWAGLSTR